MKTPTNAKIAKNSNDIIIINFKTYPETTGKNGLALAKMCEAAAKKYKADIRIAVQTSDLRMITSKVRIPVYAQHVDAIAAGQSTGWITIDSIKSCGAKGALLNHAEHKLDHDTILKTTALLKKAKLDSIVCADNDSELSGLKNVQATILCIEPPELIGGKISVTDANPSIIKKAVDIINRSTPGKNKTNPHTPLLIGAGIKSNVDFARAIELGAQGILISSGIALAKNKTLAIKNLLSTKSTK